MTKTWVGALTSLALLAACGNAGGVGRSDPYAPPGVAQGEAVDGLTVGHRLMAAGEFELALKAYYRAAAEQGTTVDVLSAIGSCNLQLGRLGQAEQLLRRAIEVDGSFVPAWNNLGVVLMEEDKIGESVETFKRAFALDSGQSARIRDNLKLALAKLDDPGYSPPDNTNFELVRRGSSEYLLLSKR